MFDFSTTTQNLLKKIARKVKPCNWKYGELNLAIENMARFKFFWTVPRGSWQVSTLQLKILWGLKLCNKVQNHKITQHQQKRNWLLQKYYYFFWNNY